jgi:hypothetical protein
MTWDTNENTAEEIVTISRADAIVAIKKMAKDNGYNKFRVTYEGDEIEASDLPDDVDMSKVRISAMLNNA